MWKEGVWSDLILANNLDRCKEFFFFFFTLYHNGTMLENVGVSNNEIKCKFNIFLFRLKNYRMLVFQMKIKYANVELVVMRKLTLQNLAHRFSLQLLFHIFCWKQIFFLTSKFASKCRSRKMSSNVVILIYDGGIHLQFSLHLWSMLNDELIVSNAMKDFD